MAEASGQIEIEQATVWVAPEPRRIDFTQGPPSDPLLGFGWERAEAHGRWTLGDFSQLRIPVDQPAERLKITLLVSHIFATESRPSQELIVACGDRQLLRTRIDRMGTRLTFYATEEDQAQLGDHWVTGFDVMLIHADAISPREAGVNDDPRRLALMISEMTVEAV